MLAWYFAPADRKLRYGDGRTVRKGATHAVNHPEHLTLCKYGLHASPRLLDALGHAPGYVLCRVKLAGRIVRGDDKVCAEKRTYLAVLPENVTQALLAEWSRACALRVAQLWNAPEIVVRWLKTGDESIRVEARNAAADAAYAAYAAYVDAAYADAARAATRADAARVAAAADAARAAAAYADAACVATRADVARVAARADAARAAAARADAARAAAAAAHADAARAAAAAYADAARAAAARAAAAYADAARAAAAAYADAARVATRADVARADAARAAHAAADVATERDWQNKALTRLALKAIREQK